MTQERSERSPELDQVRRLLFPNLPEGDGWARIDGAFAGAADAERLERIEELADDELTATLLTRLLRLHPPDQQY